MGDRPRLRRSIRVTESTYARVMRTKYELGLPRADDVVNLLLDFWEKREILSRVYVEVGRVSALTGQDPLKLLEEAAKSANIEDVEAAGPEQLGRLLDVITSYLVARG